MAAQPTGATLDLTGRTAMVTGAGSGIGAACARRLAVAGAHVLLVDVDGDAIDRLAKELMAQSLTSTPVVCDLADMDAVDALPAAVDLLVNNAGLQHVAPIHEFPPQVFHQVLTIMLEAPFRLTRRVLPHMYAAGWGRIINISSVHGLRASPFKAAYVAAKHGLEGLSKVISLEGAEHGVTSNCISPAYVRTPLVERQIADQAKAHGITEDEVVSEVLLAPMALKRLVEADEVAELAAYLSGPASTSVTGASFTMDGGWTAH